MSSAYKDAGVDYTQINPAKDYMVEVSRRTRQFCEERGVRLREMRNSHGVAWEYFGPSPHLFVTTLEGLGNKSWIAEWMYQHANTGRTYCGGLGIDTARMAVNDALAHGARPAVYVDMIETGTSEWFGDEKRRQALGESFFTVCQEDRFTLGAGESPVCKYLLKATAPVIDAPTLSGTIVSVVAPADRLITGDRLCPGLAILGAPSSGLHANGISLVIKEALKQPDQFLTKLPNGNTLGEEALIPTRSYVPLIEALQDEGIDLYALLPGTGGGVAKLASDKRRMTYRVKTWLPDDQIPQLFRFLHEVCGLPLEDCLSTFNWGIGYYLFVLPKDVVRIIEIGKRVGHDLIEIGRVEEGPRQTIFEPANNLVLPPPEG